MKVLVTGHKGYIGQHLIKLLEDEYPNIEVMVYDGDLCDKYAFAVTDTIIHLAALVRVNESVKIPRKYYTNNIDSTVNLLERFTYKNFIFASSGTASNPQNPYALSKRVCEDLVVEKCVKSEKDYSIFRFYNVTGTSGFEPTNPDGLLYNLMKAVKTGKFHLHGIDYNTKDGTCVRDYVHVNEICHSLIKAIYQPSYSVENLGTGTGYTVREIIDVFKKVNNVDFEVIEEPRREGDLESMVLDNVSSYYTKLYDIERLLKVNRWPT